MSTLDIFAAGITIVLFIVMGFKIYKNTKQMRGTEKKSRSNSPEALMHDFIDQPELWIKLAKGISATSPEEEVRLTLMVNAAFQGFESQCEQAEDGTLDDTGILALEEAVHRICAMPGVEKYLVNLKPDLSQRLQTIIDQKS